MEHLHLFRFIYLLGAVNAIFFSILLFKKTQRSKADEILGVWLIILSLQLIIPFIYLIEISDLFKYAGYEVFFFAFHPVFLFDYIQCQTGKKRSIKKRILIYLPAFLCGILTLWSMQMPAEEKIQLYLLGNKIPIKIIIAIGLSLSNFETFLFLSFMSLWKHKRNVLQIYSFRDNVDLYWLWKLLISFSLIYFVAIVFVFILYFMGATIILADFIFYGLMSIFIFFLGYWGWQQGNIFNSSTNLVEIGLKQKIPVVTKNNKPNRIELSPEGLQLKAFMEREKPFLNQNLSLLDLANETESLPHQLSRLIHREFGINFFEFVNKYRVEYFKKIVNIEPFSNFTILAVAYECGFNSKASFNRIFKEYTGITPMEFREKLKSQLIET